MSDRDVAKEVAEILRLPPDHTPGDIVEGVRQISYNLDRREEWLRDAREHRAELEKLVLRVLDTEGAGTAAPQPTAEDASAFYRALQDLRLAMKR